MANTGGSDSVTSDPAPAAPSSPPSAARQMGVTAGGAAVFLVLRVFAISKWNWHTASDVLGTINFNDAISIAFGTLVAKPVVTGLLLALLLPVAVIDVVWPTRGARRQLLSQSLWIVGFGVTFFALIKTFRLWWLPAAALAVAAAIVALRLLWRRGTGRRLLLWILNRVGVMALISLLALAALVQTPWMPKEQIITRAGDVRGYVLDVESGYLQVLTEGSRRTVIIISSDVEARRVIE